MILIFSLLQLFKPDGQLKYLDCTKQEVCNWMMFVRCARNYQEQNLAAYQHDGKIYFVSVKVKSHRT